MQTTSEGLLKLNRQDLLDLVVKCKEDKNSKGVLLLGKPGMGKTTILHKVLGKTVDSYDLTVIAKKKDGDITDAIKLATVESDNISKNKAVNYYKTTGIVIDDLGFDKPISLYGNTYDPIQDIIVYAYKSKYRLWATSNYDLKMLMERYGKRVLDRLKEMCYIVVLDDTNFRDTLTQDNNEIKNLLS